MLTTLHKINLWMMWLPLVVLWLMAGCSGGKHFEVPQNSEIPKGPGVFTKGDDGAVLYDSEGGGLIDPHKKKRPQESASASGQAAATDPPDEMDNFKAFEAYKQWLEWKKTAEGTDEYREFKDWQEWKRYQEWKQRQ